jgi:hypothetical protein
VLPHEERIGVAIVALPVDVRRALVRVLVGSPEPLAEAIGDLSRRRPGASMAEFLIDLESDRRLALT